MSKWLNGWAETTWSYSSLLWLHWFLHFFFVLQSRCSIQHQHNLFQSCLHYLCFSVTFWRELGHRCKPDIGGSLNVSSDLIFITIEKTAWALTCELCTNSQGSLTCITRINMGVAFKYMEVHLSVTCIRVEVKIALLNDSLKRRRICVVDWEVPTCVTDWILVKFLCL